MQLAGSTSAVDLEEIYFDFRKQRFIYSKEKETFCKLPYPTKETFGYYLKNTGYGSEPKVVAAVEKWGRNMWVFLCDSFLLLLLCACVDREYFTIDCCMLEWGDMGYQK